MRLKIEMDLNLDRIEIFGFKPKVDTLILNGYNIMKWIRLMVIL